MPPSLKNGYFWVAFDFMTFLIVKFALYFYSVHRNLCLTLRPGCAPRDLLLLWKHECDWVYGRRLIDSVDRERFQQAFLTAAKKRFTDDEQVFCNGCCLVSNYNSKWF